MTKQQYLAFCKGQFAEKNVLLRSKAIEETISLFLFRYIQLEVFYKKMYIAMEESKGNKMTPKEIRNLTTTVDKVHQTLRYFDVKYDIQVTKDLFGSENKNYATCSFKKLRDKIVHDCNPNAMREVINRYDVFLKDYESFLGYFDLN